LFGPSFDTLPSKTGGSRNGLPLRGLTNYILIYTKICLFQILGGRLALKVGGKMVYGAGMLISIICTVLVPVGARLSPYVLIVLRVIQGLAMVKTKTRVTLLYFILL
jgi:MFS family permease